MRTIRWFLSYLVPIAIIVVGVGTYVYWDSLDEVWEKTSQPFVVLKQKWQQAFNDEKEAEQITQTAQVRVQPPGFMPPNAMRGTMPRSMTGSMPMQRGAMPPSLPPKAMQARPIYPGMMGRPPMQPIPPMSPRPGFARGPMPHSMPVPPPSGFPHTNQSMGQANGMPPRPGMNPSQPPQGLMAMHNAAPHKFMMPFKVSVAEKLTDKQVTQLKQARKAFWQGDLTAASEKYNTLLDGEQKNPDVLGEMGNVQWAMGNQKAASETYFKAGEQFILHNNFMRVRFVSGILIQFAPDKAKQLDEQARAHFESLMKNKIKG